MSSSSSRNKRYVTLRSSDGQEFKVEQKLMAKKSRTVRHALAANNSYIELPKVDAETVTVLLSKCMNRVLDKEFVVEELEESLFFNLLVAASFLEMKELIRLLYVAAPQVMTPGAYREVQGLLEDLVSRTSAKAKSSSNWLRKIAKPLRNLIVVH